MTGGWGAPRKRPPSKRPPSNDPERLPKGPASVSKAPPTCCANCKCHEQENSDDR